MNQISELLTIVLPLKGREDFTLRYLNYLDSISCPFRILVADGSSLPIISNLFKDNDTFFKNLRIEYRRFSEDLTLQDFYFKMAEAVKLVKTPYVMLNDNDDYPVLSGIYESLSFLEKNSDFIGVSGIVGGMTIRSKDMSSNKEVQLHDYYCSFGYVPRTFDEENPLDRIKYRLENERSYYLYYCIFRTPIIQKITYELQKMNFNDLRLHEFYFMDSALLEGKIFGLKNFYTYIRQIGTSIGSKLIKDWYNLLFLENWMQEFDIYRNALVENYFSNIKKQKDLSKIAEKKEEIFEKITEYFLKYLYPEYSPVCEKHLWEKIKEPKSYYYWAKNKIYRILSRIKPIRTLTISYRNNCVINSVKHQQNELWNIIRHAKNRT